MEKVELTFGSRRIALRVGPGRTVRDVLVEASRLYGPPLSTSSVEQLCLAVSNGAYPIALLLRLVLLQLPFDAPDILRLRTI